MWKKRLLGLDAWYFKSGLAEKMGKKEREGIIKGGYFLQDEFKKKKPKYL